MRNGVIARKLSLLDEVANELETLRPLDLADLESQWTVRRAVERDLQVLSETVIDVCQRLLSLAGEGPATSAADAVRRCVALGAISNRETYVRMAQMRNVIVHRYDQVDPQVLVKVVNNGLEQYRSFRAEVLDYTAGVEEDGSDE